MSDVSKTGSSSSATDTMQTGYQSGDPTGGAAPTSGEDTGRNMNTDTAFAINTSPAARVSNIATLQNEFPDDIKQFQAVQQAKRDQASIATEARQSQQSNYGLVQNAETGEYEWAAWDNSGVGRPDDETAASQKYEATNMQAFSSSNVEDTLLAFDESENKTGSDSSDDSYYYGEDTSKTIS